MPIKKTAIILNGECFTRQLSYYLSQGYSSTYCFSLAAYSQIPFTHFLWEPILFDHVFVSERVNKDSIAERSSFFLSSLLLSFIPVELERNKQLCVFVNPVINRNLLNSIGVNWTGSLWKSPQYFFVNERTPGQSLISLKQYFDSGLFKSHPLNFRCSPVRALSLAFIDGAQTIDIYGMNPSVNKTWIGRSCSPLLKAESAYINSLLDQLFELEDLCQPEQHGGILNQNLETSITYSIFLYIRLLLVHASRDEGGISGKIAVNIFSPDPLVGEIASMFNLSSIVKYV
jgi:hypothetical protein